MAFKMKGFSGFKKETNLPEEETHATKTKELESDVKTFQNQYDEDPNEKTLKDLNWSKQILEEHKTGA